MAQKIPSRGGVSALYERYVLDPLVEIARAVAHDFVQRPRQYRAIPENIADILEGFRTRTGCDPAWPSVKQRVAIFAPIFDAAFESAASELRKASVAYAERCNDSSDAAFEERVMAAAITFRGHLKLHEGRFVAIAERSTGAIFQSAARIFQNGEIAAAFGLQPAPANWPKDGIYELDSASAEVAYLLREIQRSLVLSASPTEQQLQLLQRIAHYGGATLARLSQDSGDWKSSDGVRALVADAYGWERALQAPDFIFDINVLPRVVRDLAIDNGELKSLPGESQLEPGVIALQIGGGGGAQGCTCHDGWTRICDLQTHMASTQYTSCHVGVTYYCETGPTCTSGWTLQCDKWPIGAIRAFTAVGIGLSASL